MTPIPHISVVICTHNRARYLFKALQSLANQSLDRSLFEIVIIDNASTDDTERVVLQDFAELDHLRYIREPVLGSSRAKNTGWQQSRGEYVAFLDDDAVADRDWLRTILEFMSSCDPQPGLVGGRVVPIWEAERPVWLSDDLARALTIIDWPVDDVSVLQSQWWVATANLVFPRQVLSEIGGFRTDLGPMGERHITNEENLVRLQVEKLGRPCYYHPRICVRHHAHASRLCQSWFKQRLKWQGVSQARLQHHFAPRRRVMRFMQGLKVLGKFFCSPRSVVSWLRPTADPKRFQQKCLAWYRVGYGAGLMGIDKWL